MAKDASFMPKYDNFANQPLSRKPLPIKQKYAQFRCPAIERVYVQLLELWPMTKLVVKQSAKAHGPLVFLYSGFTLASFRISGKVPVANDFFKIMSSIKGKTDCNLHILMSLIGISKSPIALFV